MELLQTLKMSSVFKVLFLHQQLLCNGGELPILPQEFFEGIARESEMEMAIHRNGNAPRLFRNDNGNAIALLGDAEGSTVAQTEVLGYVLGVAHGEDTTSGTDALLGNDHRTIVQGTVFEKEVLDEALTDGSIDNLATL